MNNADYHAHPALSASGLKMIKRSPLHYWSRYLDPDRVAVPPTEAMQLGTVTHCAVLEPEEFDLRYIAVPEGIDKRTKEGKQVWADLLASGREPHKAATIERVKAIAAAVHANPLAADLMAGSEREASVFDDMGLFKIRPDIMHMPCDRWHNGMIVDLKTTTNAGPDEWSRKVVSLDMMIQAAFYRHIFYHKFGAASLPEFRWIVVETESPHAVAVYQPSADYMSAAIDEMGDLITLYMQCRYKKYWPSYSDKVETVEMPNWLKKSAEIEVSYL